MQFQLEKVAGLVTALRNFIGQKSPPLRISQCNIER